MYFVRLKVVLMIGFSCFVFSRVSAEMAVYNQAVKSKVVLQAGKDVVGQEIVYPKTEHAEVTGLEVRIPAGQETGWHTHSVPGYAYVISGTLTLEYEKGITRQFKRGDAFAEVVNVLHNGQNNGSEEVVLIVFFTGEAGVPFTRKKGTTVKE